MQQDGSLSVSNTAAKTAGIPGLSALLELVPLAFHDFMAVFCKMLSEQMQQWPKTLFYDVSCTVGHDWFWDIAQVMGVMAMMWGTSSIVRAEEMQIEKCSCH